MNVGMCTIISKNYISLARTLVKSFLEHHPDGKAFVLLVDRNMGEINKQEEKFELIELTEINLPEEKYLCFKYNITELNTSVKPFFLEYLLKQFKIDKLVYFDPDILVMHKLDMIYELLEENNIVLTPHILSPINDDHLKPNEIDLLQAGTYNLGFIGLAKNNIVFNFLKWWQERLIKYCVIDFPRGLFVDQKWIDLVPGMYEKTFILREPTYNVAYWNLHERKLYFKNNMYYVNGKPLVFYHFSGFNISLNNISKHQNRFQLREVPYLYSLFNLYRQKILAQDYLLTYQYKYSYDYFDNGVKIPDIFRKIFVNLGDRARIFSDPFNTTDANSFFKWLAATINDKSKVSRFLYEIYSKRPDLQAVFPKALDSNPTSLNVWARSALTREYNIDKALLDLLIN